MPPHLFVQLAIGALTHFAPWVFPQKDDNRALYVIKIVLWFLALLAAIAVTAILTVKLGLA